MNLIINGKKEEITQEKINIEVLLKLKNVEMPDMVSVQLNEEFVKKENYDSVFLKENDAIDFLYFMGGGTYTPKGIITKSLHTKFLKKDIHGSLNFPIYETAAFEFDNSEDIELAFTGKKASHMYTRITNPTVEYFEQKVKNITGAFGVLALSSGMAAISSVILSCLKSGSNLITTKRIFGNTASLFEKTLKQWGLEVRYADLNNPESVRNLIDDKTGLIFFETISNPQIEIIDIKKISDIAKDNNIIVAVDTTLTPLYFADYRSLGVDIEIVSGTKYISGGATSVGGLIIDHGIYDWNKCIVLKDEVKKFGSFAFLYKLKKESYRNLGACLSPHNAYLQALGLDTITLRAERCCLNALKISEHLEKNKKVLKVNYPGLKSNQFHEIAKKQFNDLFGSLLTFELKDKNQCFKFMDNLSIIRRATNLNDNKSLIIHPSSTIFSEFDGKTKLEMGVNDKMLRLSAGIEDIDDLLNDIDQSLEVLI